MDFIRKIVQDVMRNEHILTESVSLKTVPFLYAIKQRYPGEWKIYFEAKKPFNAVEVGSLDGLRRGNLKAATRLFQNDFEFINHGKPEIQHRKVGHSDFTEPYIPNPWTVQRAIRKVWESLEKVEIPMLPGKVFAFKVAETGEWFIASAASKSVVGELLANGEVRYTVKDENGNDAWKVVNVDFKDDPINAARYIYLNIQKQNKPAVTVKPEAEVVSLNEAKTTKPPMGFIGYYKVSSFLDGEMYQFYIGERYSGDKGVSEIKIGKLLSNGKLYGLNHIGRSTLDYTQLGEGFRFDIVGAQDSTTLLWNNLKEKEFLKGTGLFAINSSSQWYIYNSDDIHKYGAPRNIAKLQNSGVLHWRSGRESEQVFDSPIQAMRFIYINTQKPNSKNGIVDEAESFKNALHKSKAKTFIPMPDVAGYNALFDSADPHTMKPAWQIYNENSKKVVIVSEDGSVLYRNIGEFFNSGWEKPIDNINFGFNEDGVKQAARWYYINHGQKPNPITEGVTSKADFVFPDIDGYKVFGPYFEMDYKFWNITDKTGTNIAELNGHGALEYLVIDDEGDDMWIPVNTKFQTTPDGIEKAARYVYIMKQTPNYDNLTESEKEYDVKFPNIENYSATREVKDEMVGWKIFDSNKEEVGYFTVDGTLMYKMPEIGSYRTVDVKIPNLKNAVRYLYLNSQQTLDNFKKGDRHYFPDVDNWYAVRTKDGYFNISDQEGHSKGFFTHNGEVWIYKQDTENKYSGNSFPFTKEGLENAVRYVYLQTQTSSENAETELTEVMHGAETKISGLDGWSVIESHTDKGVPWWDIMDSDGVWIGYFMKVGNKYKLTYTALSGEQINVDQDFGTDYINAARYVYLMRQKAK